AEDEDQARGGEAAQADRLGKAHAGGRLEAAQAPKEGSQAPPEASRGKIDRQSGRGPAAGARALSVIEEEPEHATGKRWSQDAPAAQEDPQEGEGVLRRAPEALQDSRRDRPARGGVRVPRPQAEEAPGAEPLDRADQRRLPSGGVVVLAIHGRAQEGRNPSRS